MGEGDTLTPLFCEVPTEKEGARLLQVTLERGGPLHRQALPTPKFSLPHLSPGQPHPPQSNTGSLTHILPPNLIAPLSQASS
jgi:hypothetical protein